MTMKKMKTKDELEKWIKSELSGFDRIFEGRADVGFEITMGAISSNILVVKFLCSGEVVMCRTFEYREDRVPPVNNSVVYVRTSKDDPTHRRVSSGGLNADDELGCYFPDGGGKCYWELWCDANDHSNTSYGWNQEWNLD